MSERNKRRALTAKDVEPVGKAKKVRHESARNVDLIRQDDSVFGELVSQAGASLTASGSPVHLSLESVLFQHSLQQSLKRHVDYPEVIEEFVNCLSKHLEDVSRLHSFLLPTVVVSANVSVSAVSGVQDSLLRLLLGISDLQPRIMSLLLEKLVDINVDEIASQVDLPRLIMNQFRWLSHIVNSKELVEKMFEVLTVTPLDVQREIISCFPEVIDDLQHSDVARELNGLITTNSQLTVPILDVLSNLNLTPDLLTEVRNSAVHTLSSADIEDVPVVVRFLLQTATPADALMVMCDIRENVDLTSVPAVNAAAAAASKTSCKKESRGHETLVLDALQSGIRFQKFIADATLKAIDSVKCSEQHRVIDVLLLLALHSIGYRKQVETLCRSKIVAGHLTELILQTAFKSHAMALREYFSSILQLAEVLLRSSQPIVVHFACMMYRHAFSAFDTYCRQEIVGNLVTHIGSGFAGEIESSLDILNDLVECHLRQMAPFAVFVKGVLDYLDTLTMSQIRKLYCMLCRLAFSPDAEDNMIQDALHIIVRKQLSNNVAKYQQMGVIGAVMIIMNLANKKRCQSRGDVLSDISQNSGKTSAAFPDDVYQQVISLLQLVKSSCRSPTATAMFMEEVSVVLRLGVIHSKVEEWISENVTNDFQDDFIVDVIPDQKQGEDDLPWHFNFGLDDDSEGAIGVNLLSLVVPSRQLAIHGKDLANASRPVSAWCLASHFRLLSVCEKRQHADNLEGIDALLGCPVKLPRLEKIFEKLNCLSAKEQRVLCDSLFLSVNWFREVINAFSSQVDVEMKAKVLKRLCNVTELNQYLEKCIAAMSDLSDYIPPPANFDAASDSKPITLGVAKKSAAKGKAKKSKSAKKSKKTNKKKSKRNKKKKKTKEDGEEDDSEVEESDVEEDGSNADSDSDDSNDNSRNETVNEKDSTTVSEETAATSSSTASIINSTALMVYLREFDMDVFSMLRVGLITKAALDTNMNTKVANETEILQLQPVQLRFLLDDLVRKLEHSLLASASKRRCFLKPKAEKSIGFRNLDQLGADNVARYTVDLLPVLCQHTESTSAFFQALIVSNDGLLDGPGSYTEESHVMAGCLQLLLRALLALFSWSGFILADNKDLFQKAVGVLAGRLSADSNRSSQVSFASVIRLAFSYVAKFSGSVPTLTSAVTLCRLLSCVAGKNEAVIGELRTKTGDMALSLLRRRWFAADGEIDKGPTHNEQLHTLLQSAFAHSDDVSAILETLVTTAIPELQQPDSEGVSTTFPTLTKHSYHVYYRVMLHELVESVKGITPGKSNDPDEEKIEKLVQWNSAVKIFHTLVNLIKEFDGTSNLTVLLKSGRQFVDVFITRGMPMLDHMFRAHRDDIQSLLKNLQLSTRALHHLCGHSKITKNVSLTNQVPQLKKTLEGFVYRVKAMLTVNQCLEAFWLGNLKNRDLKGAEIVSQVSVVQPSDSSSCEDSLPEDEESDDESENSSVRHKGRTVAAAVADSDEELDPQSFSETF